MSTFQLDERLANDCILLGEMDGSLLLLMNNKLVKWFILVPKTSHIELYLLSDRERKLLNEQVNLLSKLISETYSVDKINTGTIGNVVSQLHLHVIGRRKDDYCWPNVVWGNPQKESYSTEEIENIRHEVSAWFEQKIFIKNTVLN